MTYDPVGLINTSIAAVVAAAAALVLWAIVAPQTPKAARRRFVRTLRRAFRRIAAPRERIGLAEFETAMTEALDQLRGYLRDDRPEDMAIFEAGMALLGAGRELIGLRENAQSSATAGLEVQIARLAGCRRARWVELARRIAKETAAKCLAELRGETLGTEQAQIAARNLGAFAAIAEELERGSALLAGKSREGVPFDAA